jgi:SAM-dependent methyltransferase
MRSAERFSGIVNAGEPMPPINDTSSGHRECPVCDGTEPRVLFRQQFAVTDATPVHGYDVVVCGKCGCAYADAIPSQAAFDGYYRAMSKYEYHQREGAESPFDRKRLVLTAEILTAHVPDRAARVLDVGCATGRLLVELRDRGFRNVEGLDPSPSCAIAARKLYDIAVRTMTLGELAATQDQFDIVIMVGVLEHLRDVSAAFAHLHRVVGRGGLLYVDVPDATTFADWPNAPFQDFSTEHINFFGPVALDNLMRRHGFSRVFFEQNHREQSHATVMSNISAIYRHDSSDALSQPVFDHESVKGLERYITQSVEADRQLHERIDAVVASGRPILVWGVGTHTSRLIATSRLSEAQIVGFIESNARYHGKTLNDRPILAPEALRSRGEPVLISSRVFQREIADQIRNDLGCSNELVLLYDL